MTRSDPDPPAPDPQRFQELLSDTQGGPAQDGEIVEQVYAELRRIAEHRLALERPDHTLQATALVNEAYLRLVGDERARDPRNSARFYAAAAGAMRRILVDHARCRGRARRGGGQRKIPLDALELAQRDDPGQVVIIEDALQRLEQLDPRLASVVELRFYAGLADAEIARILDLSERTVRREWTLARAWLHQALTEGE
jgi:RNA polymerase sigma factor (TIGR02999 family)